MRRRLASRAQLASIRNRLALVFFAITLAAISVVYSYVAPSLQTNLVNQRLHQLERAAAAETVPLAHAIGTTVRASRVERDVRRAADAANAHVVLLGVSRGSFGEGLYLVADSRVSERGLVPTSGPAVAAARTARVATGLQPGSGARVGQVAQPLLYRGRVAQVALYSTPLDDVRSNVALVRRRILIAGGLALVLAVLGGYLTARALSQRIKRLEQAAGRVAAGDFSARFPVDSADELGELARALGAMQRQLAELDSARKQFIATASHELRTPIFSLGGFLELIQDEELDDETRNQFVGQVREQVDRLGKLATGLLDLSRLEAGSLELRRTRTDVAAVARAVTSEFIPALSQASAHLELRLAREPLMFLCDPERVAQVLRILVDNAIIHTPPETDIVVHASEREGRLSLSVRDSGPGLRGAAVDRIFEPFYTSDDAQGSGLGLAIARELAERMDGSLSVDSRPGSTTFSLELGR